MIELIINLSVPIKRKGILRTSDFKLNGNFSKVTNLYLLATHIIASVVYHNRPVSVSPIFSVHCLSLSLFSAELASHFAVCVHPFTNLFGYVVLSIFTFSSSDFFLQKMR